MDDLISRQAAIDAVVAWTVEDRPDIEMPTDLVGRINALPSAQPEQKTGKWIQNDIAEKLGIWLCSECEQPINLVNERGELQKLNYCPNCGAKMEEDKDEID